jgi:hypothetical protein
MSGTYCVEKKDDFLERFFKLMSQTIPEKYIIAKLEIQTASLKILRQLSLKIIFMNGSDFKETVPDKAKPGA